MPKTMQYPSQADVCLPFAPSPPQLADRSTRDYLVTARLRDHVTVKQAQAEIQTSSPGALPRHIPQPMRVGRSTSSRFWRASTARSSSSNLSAIESNQLQFDKIIGQGSFGQVWKGKWRGTVVAIKQVKMETVNEKSKQSIERI